jgi:hypothetical protein
VAVCKHPAGEAAKRLRHVRSDRRSVSHGAEEIEAALKELRVVPREEKVQAFVEVYRQRTGPDDANRAIGGQVLDIDREGLAPW